MVWNGRSFATDIPVGASESSAASMAVPCGTLARLERGTHRPSADTARALARWLGWTTDQVLDAADQPAPLPESPSEKP